MDDPNQNASNKVAPWFSIPVDPVMSVEHPCLVKNSMKGIDMLGGSRTISQVLDAGAEKVLPLFFKPQDPTCRSVLSLHNETSNVLLKVTVPKRTGRKRKRGSFDDFVEDPNGPESKHDAAFLSKSMADNQDNYSIEPIGNITTTHVWRNMPDFVYSVQGSTFMKNIERHVLPQKYALLKQYSLPRTYGLEDTETIPPPVFSMQSLPQHYMYHQNPAALPVADPISGTKSILMKTQIAKTHTHQWSYDAPVPTGPVENCPPIESQPQNIQDIVKHLIILFEERPIWTRRAIHNRLPESDSVFVARYAIAYVAFAVRSGPWRDALIKFGVDPRSDRQYRFHQTVLLQLLPRDGSSHNNPDVNAFGRQWTRGDDRQSHIFDGIKPVPKDGKVWQLCDIEDEQLKAMVNVADLYLRPECEIRYFGWYAHGTLAKIRIALKAKVDGLLEGIPVNSEQMETFLQLPDEPEQSTTGQFAAGYLPSGLEKKAYAWAAAYRNMCGTPAGSVPAYGSTAKGRLSVPKPKARPSYLDPEAAGSDDDTENGIVNQDHEDEDMNGEQDGVPVDIADDYAEPVEDEEEEDEGRQINGIDENVSDIIALPANENGNDENEAENLRA